jgi:hypothetical protein
VIWPHDWRCVTQRQPNATLIAVGAKCIITRKDRPHKDDFPLGIVAGPNPNWPDGWRTRERRQLLDAYGVRPINCPTGCIVATAWMASSVAAQLCTGISLQERRLGQFVAGMWAWFLIDIFPLDEPISIDAQHDLWTPDERLALRLQEHHAAKLKARISHG